MPHIHPSVSRRREPASRAWRAVAAVLCLVLAFASVAPGFARAAEQESQGEGVAPPGVLPGLDDGPDLEPAGEETTLEESVPPPAGEAAEEEAPVTAESPPAPPSAEAAGELPAEAEAPAAEPPPPSAASTDEGESQPSYEVAAPPAAVVENEALSAPPGAAVHSQSHGDENATAQVAPEGPPAPAPVTPEAPETVVTQPVATPVEPDEATGSLKGHDFHVVRAGESLWSIATALLPGGASNGEIAVEVQQLWQLNKVRIGTGDPDLTFAGTVLRLR
jgi:hypothetical protein